jgi:hypothetical protein
MFLRNVGLSPKYMAFQALEGHTLHGDKVSNLLVTLFSNYIFTLNITRCDEYSRKC